MVVGVFEGEQCPSITVLWAPYAGGSHGNAVIEITVDYFLCTCRFPSETFETLAKNAVVRVTARGPSCFCLRPARICDKRQTRPSGQRRRKVSFRPSTAAIAAAASFQARRRPSSRAAVVINGLTRGNVAKLADFLLK